MLVFRTAEAAGRWRRGFPPAKRLGLVPTMGALHRGHLALVERSRRADHATVVSIFVNPTQFGPAEDFNRYPRPWSQDVKLLKSAGVQFVLAPSAESMYPFGHATKVVVSGLTETLCGAPTSRGPGHFEGVATVVSMLLSIVRPTHAYFGLKDFQQLRVIERLNADLHLGARIVRCPTVRESDGLALSSRNAYLSPEERSAAPGLYRALRAGAAAQKAGQSNAQVLSAVRGDLSHVPGMAVEYVELVDAETLQPALQKRDGLVLAAAVRLGSTRLIDNVLVN